jgi:hypothetical protein
MLLMIFGKNDILEKLILFFSVTFMEGSIYGASCEA